MLEANERWEQLAAELRAENGRLREALAQRDAQVEQMAAEPTVLKRLVFGRSSERARPETSQDNGGSGDGADGDHAGGGKSSRPRWPGRRRPGGITRICPGSRWSGTFPAAGTAACSAGALFTRLGDKIHYP